MKVLQHECVDWRLRRDLAGHDVRTARQMGWSEIRNGLLLRLAAAQFDVFVTVDRNLSFQNRIGEIPMAVVVLCAQTKRLADLRALVPELQDAIASAIVGTVTNVGR